MTKKKKPLIERQEAYTKKRKQEQVAKEWKHKSTIKATHKKLKNFHN